MIKKGMTYVLMLAALLVSGSIPAMAEVEVKGSVFGGGNNAGVGASLVNINGGKVVDGVYGGCNANGTVTGDIVVNINGGTLGTSSEAMTNGIFGGGYGASTGTNGNVTVNVGDLTVDGSGDPLVNPVIYADIYGGSALGSVNDAAADATTVNVLSGTVHGNIYGGGLGEANVVDEGGSITTNNSAKGQVNGTVEVNIGSISGSGSSATYSGYATIDGSVYGCNNTNGSPQDDVAVNVYKTGHNTTNTATYIENDGTNGNPTYAIDQVFGGGNQAAYAPATVASGTPHSATVHVYTCDNTVETIYGGGNAADATDVKLIIDGGRFDRVFGGGNGYSETGNHSDPLAPNYNPGANITGSATTLIHGGYYHQVFGGSNQYGDVASASLTLEATSECGLYVEESFGGANEAVITGNVTTTLACSETSGTIGSFYGGSNQANINGNVTLNVYGGTYTNVFGGSKGDLEVLNDILNESGHNDIAANIDGNVTLKLYGGTMENAFGGSNYNGNITGKITVNMLNLGGSCELSVHNVYGASNLATYTPTYPIGEGETRLSPEVNILHGTVSKKVVTENEQTTYTGGNVFGGGLGATAIVTSNPVVTVGYDATTMSGLLPTSLPEGYSLPQTYLATVAGDVYGGGDAAAVTGNTIVNFQKDNNTVANLFGGGNAAGVSGTASVNLSAGSVTAGVYGGCNSSGSVGGAITVNVTGGTVGAAAVGTVGQEGYVAEQRANVYGGGLGTSTRANGDVAVNIGTETTTTTGEGESAVTTTTYTGTAVIYGDVYGGSAKGLTNCNDEGTAQNGSAVTNVTLNAGTIHGSLYGGGHGIDNAVANVWGPVSVVVNGGSVVKPAGNPGSIFGCNNVAGSPKNTVTVTVNSTDPNVITVPTVYYQEGETLPEGKHVGDVKTEGEYAINAVYGGGNLAHYDPTMATNYPTVTVNGCDTSIKDVYGGGNAAAVTATSVTINGGLIDRVFAGGNGESGTPAHVGYKTNTTPTDGDSYGAGTSGATITGGTINKVFGGANANGTIRAGGSVYVNKVTTSCDMHVGEVYGGGNLANGNAASISIGCTGGSTEGIGDVYGGANQANVGNNIALTISGGSIQRVFGGNNASGSISGTIAVGVNWATGNDACGYNYLGSVFGGGNQAVYTGTPAVTITNGTVSHSVYGGGNLAGVGGGNVSMTGGTVLGGIYGGCNTSGTVTGNIAVSITGGTVGAAAVGTEGQEGYVAEQRANVHGGGYGSATASEGNVSVTINGSGVNVWGDVYGGSALGNVNDATSDATGVTLTAGTIHGSLYGGGLGDASNAASVNGAVNVIINGGTVTGAVYGANNVNGSPQGTVSVVVNGTNAHTPAVGTEGQTGYTPAVYALSAVYGGGNLAACAAATTVTVNGCNASIQDVFGGGNAAAVAATSVTINGGIIDRVFAGGNGEVAAADVTGAASAIVHGGTIRQLFGGGNKSGTIGSMSVSVDKQGTCSESIAEVYGGGNMADSGPGSLTISCGAEGIGDVYGGANNATITGDIVLNINGGQINRVFGGNNNGGNITGSITVNVNADPTTCPTFSLNNVYGGGNLAAYTPTNTADSYHHPQVNIIKGTVSGNVYGGGLGASAIVHCNPEVNIQGGTVAGNVFGGGEEANVTGGVVVNMISGSVLGDLYGGGALAHTNIGTQTGTDLTATNKTTQVNLIGGTVNNVYGGGLGQKAVAATGTTPTQAEVKALVCGAVTVALNGSQESGAANNCVVKGTIFGCNNLNGSPLGHVTVHVSKTIGWTDDKGTADTGDDVSHTRSASKDDTAYEVEAVYGGGNLAAYEPTSNTEKTEVIIDGCGETSIHYVYGSGNAASTPATVVTVNGAYELGNVFGGGNGKDPYSLDGGNTWIDNPGANVGKIGDRTYGAGTTDVYLYGGYIHYAFGGSNTLGNVVTSATVHLHEATENGSVICPLNIGEVYGGGNTAFMDGTAGIELGCITGLEEIYGGAKNADIRADVVLTITSGQFHRVFGGNNMGGLISGSITVNIEETGCHPVIIGELYGGGNLAAYTAPTTGSYTGNYPEVNVKSFTSIGRIFGGGYGEDASVTGNPHVYIDEVVGLNSVTAFSESSFTLKDPSNVSYVLALPGRAANAIGGIGTVYGGGNAAPVFGETNVFIGTKEKIKYVSIADNPDTTNVDESEEETRGVDIRGDVFGAGLGETATVTGNANVVVGR